MYNSIKTVGLASLVFFLGSCSSDDNKQDPPTPAFQPHFLTSITSTTYEVENDASGNHINSMPKKQLVFTFDYNKANQVEAITRNTHLYRNGTLLVSFSNPIDYQLNETFNLTSFHILNRDTPLSSHLFTYEKGRVKSYAVSDHALGSYEHQLVYNANNQVIQSTSLAVVPQREEFTVDYTYNAAGELTSLTNNANYTVKFTYDQGKNPFDFLPFDFTTLIFDDLYFLPITYAFPHNLGSYKVSDETAFTFEHQYNKDLYPVQTTVYKGGKLKKNRYSVIDYTYNTPGLE